MSRQSSQEVCPWNGPKLVRLTREAGYLPRASRPRDQTDSDSGAARLDSDSDSGGAASGSRASGSIPGTSEPALLDLIAMDAAAWEEFSRGSAIRRAKRAGFLRNVAVALGNWGAPEAVPALARALEDRELRVRGHAAWALGSIETRQAVAALQARFAIERDDKVQLEIAAALGQEHNGSAG